MIYEAEYRIALEHVRAVLEEFFHSSLRTDSYKATETTSAHFTCFRDKRSARTSRTSGDALFSTNNWFISF